MKDLFDEYGNFVGRFEPSGGGFEGFFFLIGVVFLWAFGFLIYLFFKLIINGFKAMGRGDWGKALQYLLIPSLATFMLLCQLAAATAQGIKQQQEHEAYQQKVSASATAEARAEATATQRAVVAQQAFRESEVEAKSLVQVKDVVLLTEGQVMPNGSGMAYSIQPDKISFIRFTIVNNSKLAVGVSLPGCFPTSSINGYWPNGYVGVFDKYEPGVGKDVTCWLNWVPEQSSPENYCVPEIAISDDPYYRWHICPYRK